MSKILFIDDDNLSLITNKKFIQKTCLDYKVFTAQNSKEASKIYKTELPNVVVLDLSLNKEEGVESGFKVLQEILSFDFSVRVIVLTGYDSNEYGVRAILNGASSYLTKPVDYYHLLALIKDGINQSNLVRKYKELKESNKSEIENYLLGSSKHNKELIDSIEFATKNDLPVLIIGESGTGKGYCAELIHKLSKRKDNSFVKLQPIFSNSDLINSELFGHKKGSFTGADIDRVGLFSEAHRGTLFLDEIDSFNFETQIAFLGVLQNKKFRMLGSNTEEESDFRLITATNQDIEQALEEKKFRQDLYFRIAHLKINLLPLRERLEDIPILANNFLIKIGNQIDLIEESAINKLLEYNLPGNIRELESIIENAFQKAMFKGRRRITADDLLINNKNSYSLLNGDFNQQVNYFKNSLVKAALNKNNNSQSRTAKELGIDRGTLKRILEIR